MFLAITIISFTANQHKAFIPPDKICTQLTKYTVHFGQFLIPKKELLTFAST